jgi:hypothetical protein
MTDDEIYAFWREHASYGDSVSRIALRKFARAIHKAALEDTARYFDTGDTMVYRSEVAAAVRALKEE